MTAMQCPENHPCGLPEITPSLQKNPQNLQNKEEKKNPTIKTHLKELKIPMGCSAPQAAKSFLVFMAPTVCRK